MKRRLTLAGITFRIDYPEEVRFEEPTSGFYRPFAAQESGSEEFLVNVRSGPTVISTDGPARMLFETGESWSMYQDDQYRLLSITAPSDPEPYSLTRFRLHDPLVDVRYSRLLEEERRLAGLPLPDPFNCPVDRVLLMYVLAALQGALVHSCSGVIGGKGFLFPGISGAGKSTLARLLARHRDWEVMSDERTVVRRESGGYKLFGTPWPGDAGIAASSSGPLAYILFLSHGPTNRIDPLSSSEALLKLLPVSSIAWYDRELFPLQLSFVEGVVSEVPCYQLQFLPDQDVVELLRDFAN